MHIKEVRERPTIGEKKKHDSSKDQETGGDACNSDNKREKEL